MRLLVVEDSRLLRQAISEGLRKAGHATDVAADGEEGLWFAQTHAFDVIVLDLMLPLMDGLSVLRRLRAQGCRTHVLILTARDGVGDRVRGLDAGADDYLVKPFAFEELLARVHALGRRAHGIKSPCLSVGELRVDLSTRQVEQDGRLIELAPREFALLECLILRRGHVVSRSEIESHIYDERAEPMSNVVEAAVYALRRRIDRPGQPSLIRTRRGVGYLIETERS